MPVRALRHTLAMVLAALFLLSLAGCRRDTPQGKSFRFPLEAEPRQLDPQVSTDASSVTLVSALFEGLTRLDEEGNAIPAAAEWTVSDDGLTYTFTLRESYWSTLTENDRRDPSDPAAPWEEPIRVTAADFVFGMQRTLLPETGSPLASQLFGIQNAQAVHEGKMDVDQLGVKAVSDANLVITLTSPDPEFPEKLAGTPFMPCHEAFFEYTAGRYGLEQEYVLTNGPFVLTAWNHNQSLLLSPNENYHDADDIYPASVRYVIQASGETGRALLDGELDAGALEPSELDEAQENGFQILEMVDTIEYIWLNNSVSALSSASVRRALRDALAWDLIHEQLDSSTSTPAQGYIPPDALLSGTELYRTADNGHPGSTDAAAARQELSDGLVSLELTAMPTLQILCGDDEYSQNLARYISQSWQSHLSLYFNITPLSEDELLTRVQVGNYQIAIAPQTGRDLFAYGLLAAFLSDAQSGNWARFRSESYDALYAQAAQGGVTRQEIDALEQKLIEECPSIPLSFQKRFFGIPASCSGIVIRPFGGGAYGAQFDFRHAGKLD